MQNDYKYVAQVASTMAMEGNETERKRAEAGAGLRKRTPVDLKCHKGTC